MGRLVAPVPSLRVNLTRDHFKLVGQSHNGGKGSRGLIL
jgi:hypothetical protein